MTSTAFVAAAPCAPQLSRPSLLARRPRTRREITGRRSAPRAVLPALAAEAASVAADSTRAAADAATVAAADAASAASDAAAAAGMSVEDFGNAGPQRWLATLAFFLVAYLSLGVLVLSWDEWRKKRNSEREIEEWRAAGGAKRKWGATGRAGGSGSDAGLNRESRRMAKKREAQEKRDKRKTKK